MYKFCIRANHLILNSASEMIISSSESYLRWSSHIWFCIRDDHLRYESALEMILIWGEVKYLHLWLVWCSVWCLCQQWGVCRPVVVCQCANIYTDCQLRSELCQERFCPIPSIPTIRISYFLNYLFQSFSWKNIIMKIYFACQILHIFQQQSLI